MATGASNSDLAVILIDARKGVLTQTRRHAYIASLLGIRHVVLAVNKIDLVGYSPGDLRRHRRATIAAFAAAARLRRRCCRSRSPRATATTSSRAARTCPGTTGPSLLDHLETVDVDTALAGQAVPHAGAVGQPAQSRFPRLLRHDRRRPREAGRRRRRRRVRAAPAKVTRIVTMDGDLDEAVAGDAVTLTLADEVDISRGDVLRRAGRAPGGLRPVRRASPLDGRGRAAARPPVSARRSARKTVPAHGHRAQAQGRRQHARASRGARRWRSTRSATATSRCRQPIAFDPYARQPRHRRLHPDRPLHQRAPSAPA